MTFLIVIEIMNCGDKSLKIHLHLKDKHTTCVVIYYSYIISPRYKMN